MRIAFLSVSGQMGGSEVMLLDLVRAVRAAEPSWPLTVVAPGGGPLTEGVRALGAGAHVVAMPPALARVGEWSARGSRIQAALKAARGGISLRGYERAMRAALDDLAPDLIHSNGFKTHLVSARTRRGPEALVWHLHEYPGRRPLSRALVRYFAPNCDAIVANSASVAEDASAVIGAAPPVRVVHNAVDVERFSPSGPAADLDALAGLPPAPPGTVRAGLVATFSRWKGHEPFLRALAALPSGVALRGYIVGGPVYDTGGSQYTRRELESLARSLGLSGRVGFTGLSHEPDRVMRALDIVVHASTDPEPFGLVVAEAMACGRAVVTSATGGSAELVRDGVDALVHRAGDVENLVQLLARLAAEPELRARLGRHARLRALERFDGRRLGPAFCGIYREAVAARSRR